MAPLIEPILNELREEIPATRHVLERIPQEKLGWKPHAKSRSLGELAQHVANIPGMAAIVANSEEFSPGGAPPSEAASADEIRATFEKNVRAAEEVLSSMTDEKALGNWRLTFKGKEVFNKPRVAILRKVLLNHIYHHRGQLSVYRRLLDVPVPVTFGPTADENPFA